MSLALSKNSKFYSDSLSLSNIVQDYKLYSNQTASNMWKEPIKIKYKKQSIMLTCDRMCKLVAQQLVRD